MEKVEIRYCYNRETAMSQKSIFVRLLRDNMAATAIEYGLILAGISIGIIVAAQGLFSSISGVLGTVTTTIGTSSS